MKIMNVQIVVGGIKVLLSSVNAAKFPRTMNLVLGTSMCITSRLTTHKTQYPRIIPFNSPPADDSSALVVLLDNFNGVSVKVLNQSQMSEFSLV